MPDTRAPEEVCLWHLRDSGPLTSSDLVRLTGLSRPTVDSALRSLESQGVALVSVTSTGKAGRPSRMYTFGPTDVLVGVDIGKYTVRTAVADRGGHLLSMTEHHRSSDEKSFFDDLQAALAEVTDGQSVCGVGLAVPGIVKDQQLRLSRVLPELNSTDLVHIASDLVGCPVSLANDVKAAGLGEAHYGQGTPASSQLTVWLGRRISTAFTVNGDIVEGAHGLAGEITAALNTTWMPGSVYGEWDWPNGQSPLETAIRAEGGDSTSLASLDGYLTELAAPLATLVAMADPDLIVLAGALSEAPIDVAAMLETKLSCQLTVPLALSVTASRFGRYAVAVGALTLAYRDPRISLPTPLPPPTILRDPR